MNDSWNVNGKSIGIILVGISLFIPEGSFSQISTGSSYTLEKSLVGPAQQNALGGSRYVLTGSIGEPFSHATGENQYLKTSMKRLYDGFLLPLKIDPSITNVLSIGEGQVQIIIPGGLADNAYEPLMEMDPLNNSISISQTNINTAKQKLVSQWGSFVNIPSSAIEIQLLEDNNQLWQGSSSGLVKLGMGFTDRGDGGIIFIGRLNISLREWNRLSDSETEIGSNFVNFFQSQPGMYAVFQEGPIDVGKAYAYPVPWRPNGNNPALYGRHEEGITFTNIPTVGLIRIFNLAGELVRDIVIPPGSRELKWNVKTGSGNDVASGVYIWTVDSDQGQKFGKLMVIR